METMTNIWQATRLTAAGVWDILGILSRDNPGLALVAILAGLGWFIGFGAILSVKTRLEQEKLRVGVVDGRTPQKTRAEIVNDFQHKLLDVFIGGINAAGEAITLTRADTVIFVELDWVPAALLQAEDRIHRVGQRRNCQVIQLVAKMPEGGNLDEMMIELIGSKISRIGSVLDEDVTNIIGGSIQAELHERLLRRDVGGSSHAKQV